MLVAEAKWLGRVLQSLPDDAFPLINLGSSTEHFRTESHPWVDSYVFAPLRAAGREVIHVDLKASPGVDLVCDFTEEDGRGSIFALGGRSVLCSNLLEHLPQDLETSARQLAGLVSAKQMFLILTVPLSYPLHADPIDNGYRPTPEALCALFDGEVLEAAEVKCHRMAFYFADFGRRWGRFVMRIAVPVLRPRNWWTLVRWAPRRASVSCVVLLQSP